MIIDITHGRGWTEREIGYVPDITLDIRPETKPTVVGDFRNLPFPDNFADMIVFDPPHQVYGFGKAKSFVENYGSFRNIEESTVSLFEAFAECYRVLKPNGSLLFKWSTNHKSLEWVLSLSGMNKRILLERPSMASQPEKPYSHKAMVYWVELWK